MRKQIAILSLTLASLTVGASQAGAQQNGTPVYMYLYYDEYGNHVGTLRGECTYHNSVRYTLTGVQTSNIYEMFTGYCGGGVGSEPVE